MMGAFHPQGSLFLLVGLKKSSWKYHHCKWKWSFQASLKRCLFFFLFPPLEETWLIQCSLNARKNSHTCRRILNWIALHVHCQQKSLCKSSYKLLINLVVSLFKGTLITLIRHLDSESISSCFLWCLMSWVLFFIGASRSTRSNWSSWWKGKSWSIPGQSVDLGNNPLWCTCLVTNFPPCLLFSQTVSQAVFCFFTLSMQKHYLLQILVMLDC